MITRNTRVQLWDRESRMRVGLPGTVKTVDGTIAVVSWDDVPDPVTILVALLVPMDVAELVRS